MGERRLLPALVLVSVVGGVAGALLLLNTTDRAFLRLVPFLLRVPPSSSRSARASCRCSAPRPPASCGSGPASSP